MNQFIDRRDPLYSTTDKSISNRLRFLQRARSHIQTAVAKTIQQKNIQNIIADNKVEIEAPELEEVQLGYDHKGIRELVFPGNREFVKGDRLPRPSEPTLTENGQNASPSGYGHDRFAFTLSKEEFLDFFFDELALPLLEKRNVLRLLQEKSRQLAQTRHGPLHQLNVIRTFRNAKARHIALKSLATQPLPLLDPIDLRYHYRHQVLQPATNAVMFCLMDVSGSMDRSKKDLAKRFFFLLYLFLQRNYEKIELIFIRHHTSAKEVNEDDFFYSRETGGTVVSSALELLSSVIATRYNRQDWNIYVAQASDGDNWNADSPRCETLLREKILPFAQYYTYVEILPRHHQSLWQTYERLSNTLPNFSMQQINSLADIFPALQHLFHKR